MAQQKSNHQAPAPTVTPPKGFRRLGSVANAGWFNQSKIGNTISGKLLGMYVRKDELRKDQGGTSKFFQVMVDAACEVRMGRQDSVELMEAKPGDVVNLNYGPKTKDLEALCAKIDLGAEYAVWAVIAGAKITLSGGRTMHNFDVSINMLKPADASADDETVVETQAEDAPY